MSNTNKSNNETEQYARYYAEKEKAQRKYAILCEKDEVKGIKSILIGSLSAIGAASLLLTFGVHPIISIVGATIAFWGATSLMEKSTEQRIIDHNSQHFDSFEDWKTKNRS